MVQDEAERAADDDAEGDRAALDGVTDGAVGLRQAFRGITVGGDVLRRDQQRGGSACAGLVRCNSLFCGPEFVRNPSALLVGVRW